MKPKMISVIIPTYNRKEKLAKCIESVLGQSYREIEAIVVDDASADGTQELFREISDERLKYYRYETNRGACYARNYGAERAEGEFLAFQDSDDIWHAEKLEKQYRYLCSEGADLRDEPCVGDGKPVLLSGTPVPSRPWAGRISGRKQSRYADNADASARVGGTSL